MRETLSFHVNRDKGFFHCFGCGVGGDVFKFLENLHEKVGVPGRRKAARAALRHHGSRTRENDGNTVPAPRNEKVNVHEGTAARFREQLASPAAARIRQQITGRGITAAHERGALGLGFAREALKQTLLKQGFSRRSCCARVFSSSATTAGHRFNFLQTDVIPIRTLRNRVRGRSMRPATQVIPTCQKHHFYSKGRTLDGLNLSKAAVRQGWL